MPQPGDKLYDVFNGKLHTVVFLEESIVPTASVPTYEVRDADGRRRRCRCDQYATTPREAWERYLQDLQQSHGVQVSLLAQTQGQIEELADLILKATDMSRRCDAP